MFDNNLQTEATPERVYALCKIVEKKPLNLTELRERMEPEYLQNGTVYFNTYRNTAEELELISISDNVVSLSVNPVVVASLDSMRRYVNAHLERFHEGKFYMLTHEYYGRGVSILTDENSVVKMAGSLSASLGIPVSAIDMRAWRFWTSFLGLGYMQDMLLLPNAAVFLQDAIANADLKAGQYSFGNFISAIQPYCGMIFGEEISGHVINYGVSNGLRTLHDMGMIRMEHVLDQQDIWSLFPIPAHQIPETVTNVTLLKQEVIR